MTRLTGPTPEFDREATAVLYAPYWKASLIGGDTDSEHIRLVTARLAEKDSLLEALERCRTYDDLKGEAKAIYDRARATLHGKADKADTDD